jgi:integrase/recombinase XerD
MIELAFVCGLRVSEVIKVEDCNVDVRLKQLHVMGKGNKHRVVNLPGWLLERLERCLGDREGYVFVTRLGTKMTRAGFSKLLDERCEAAGVPHLNAHAFRHGCATELYSRGTPIPVIQTILGTRISRRL